MVTKRTADYDLGYFDIWPAPMYEAMTKLCPSPVINSTTPFYGPMLYTIARAIGAANVLEIGVAQGWSSGFLAWAVTENNRRYGSTGKYYGLDVADKSDVQQAHDELGLSSEFIADPLGSVHFLETQTRFYPETFDLIFVDGWHNINYVRRETELLYPLLKGNGNGYMVHHDIYSYCEKLWPEIVSDQRYKWEHLRFLPNYGLGILRKMEGYDHNKVFWPEGDQPAAEGFTPHP